MLLHNHWRTNLSKRCNLVRRNCDKLWRIWELIWRYHHELLGLILSRWINNSFRVILLATTNNPTWHCRSSNGNSSLDQGSKYLKSIASCCWFRVVSARVVTVTCPAVTIVVVTMIVSATAKTNWCYVLTTKNNNLEQHILSKITAFTPYFQNFCKFWKFR